MSKDENQPQKHPYMYIVQPEISPPESNMQSQFRAIVDQKEVVVLDVNDGSNDLISEDVVIVSSEKINQASEVGQHTFHEAEKNLDDVKEVIEVSTGVQMEQQETESKRRQPKRKTNKKQKFSDMTKEELVTFLARMPGAVPKPTCYMIINGEKMRGQVQRKRGEEYFLKILSEDCTDTIIVKMNEIEEIVVENL